MEAYDIDVLLLGREANARYIAGAQRLWTAGTRPYGPGCVVVRATGAIHLVSTWDEGIPDDIPREHLFGITWNPGNLISWLRSIEGVADAQRVGTDSLTPRFAQLLPKLCPRAEIIDAEPALQAARRIKTAEEVDAIRGAIAVAERSLAAAVGELHPGVTPRQLTGVFMDAMASNGVTTPASQRVARVASRHAGQDDGVGPDDLVMFDAGVVAGGYIGEVGRTWPVTFDGDACWQELFERTDTVAGRLRDVCRPGASCHDLLDAYGAEPLPTLPVAAALGLGFDVPVVTGALPETARRERLEAGMVLAVTATVGTVSRKDAILITADGAEILTSSPLPSWERKR
jgi:Xaa-Pro aminopeptidase